MPAMCASDGCNKTGTMACPTCEKFSVTTLFCDQQCFTASWAAHKGTHKALKTAAQTPKNQPKPRGQSVPPSRKAMALYEKAMEALNQADTKVGAELEAEKLLSRAIKTLTGAESAGQKRKRGNGEMDELLTQMHFILGRIVEAKDPPAALQSYSAAHTASPDSAEVNLHLARLRWKCASEQQHMVTVEARLRDAVRLSQMQGDHETEQDAQELLARLFCQQEKPNEAQQILATLGYTHSFASSLSSVSSVPRALASKATMSGSKLAAAQQAAGSVNAFDDVLPAAMLASMKTALGSSAPYWPENAYNSPRTGFFSFQHKLPAFPPTSAASCGLDRMLQHVWVVAAQAVPAVKKARYVEWWAHTRPHYTGHQIHFDSVPGATIGKPRHPIISTITFLTADCGGPTLITDQTIENKRSTKGWLASPRANRLVTFDGSLLHCVLPGVTDCAPIPTNSICCRRRACSIRCTTDNLHGSILGRGPWPNYFPLRRRE